jgi:hypothetical protein
VGFSVIVGRDGAALIPFGYRADGSTDIPQKDTSLTDKKHIDTF